MNIIHLYDNFIHDYLDNSTRGLAMINLGKDVSELENELVQAFLFSEANNFLTKYKNAYFWQKGNVYPSARKRFIIELDKILSKN